MFGDGDRPMKTSHAALACAALLLAACDSLFGPKTYEEAAKAAAPAYKAGDMAKAFKLCQRAVEIADKVGHGGKAINALDCAADAALRMGKPEKALPAYAAVLGTYDSDLKSHPSRFLLHNNHGVTLYNAGKKAEAINTIERAIDTYEATSQSRAFHTRMRLVINLAHAAMDSPDSAIANRLAGEFAEEIEDRIAGSTHGVHLIMGGAEALDAIAKLVRKRGDGARADQLAAIAAEQQSAEDTIAARSPTLQRECEKLYMIGGQFESCFRKIP